MLFDSHGDPIPFLRGNEAGDALARAALEGNLGEFSCAASFEPAWAADLMRSGFLPMGMDYRGQAFFLPKLHRRRALLDWHELSVSRSARSAARGYHLVVDGDFPGILASCVERHGDDWLTGRLQDLFLKLHDDPPPGLRLLSFELFPEGKPEPTEASAGEIGYACGSSYTSLSGFYREDGTGTVQLGATGAFLALSGFSFWDLGMPMEYKNALGARDWERGAFLQRLSATRDRPIPSLKPQASMNARDLMGGFARHRR